MNIYKVTGKQKKNEPFWDNSVLLIVAADYGSAQDKAKNFEAMKDREISSIIVCGETTHKQDVFIYNDR